MSANGIDGGRDLHDELLQLEHALDVMLTGSVVHGDIELREHVGTTVDAALGTQQHALTRNLLRANEHGEVLAVLHLIHHALEIDGIG